MYKKTSSFFRDISVRGPGDFGPKTMKNDKQKKMLKIKRILEERTSRTGTVWVTAEVHKRKEPVHGVLPARDDETVKVGN